MVSVDDWWSPVPLFILFREAIEASIIVAVLLQFLNRSGPWLQKQVWWGVALGVAGSVIVGIIFIILYYKAQEDAFRGRNQLIFKGACSWLAALLIGMLGFAMLRFMGWEEKWKRRLKEMAQKVQDGDTEVIASLAEHGGAAPPANLTWKDKVLNFFTCSTPPNSMPPAARTGVSSGCMNSFNKMLGREDAHQNADNMPTSPSMRNPGCWGRMMGKKPVEMTDDQVTQMAEYAKMKALHDLLPARQRYGLFVLSFVTVLREGLESVIFLAGVGNAKATAIPLGGVIGIICGVCVGVLLYYTGKQIKDLHWLMIIMSTIIFFIGAGQCELGANNLMYAGAFGPFIGPSGTPYPSAEYQSLGLLPIDAGAIAAGGGAAAAFNDGDEFIDYTAQAVTDDLYTNSPRYPQPWYFSTLWDVSKCCSDQDAENRFLSLMNKIFGYNAKPTFIDVVAYCGYWVIVLVIMMWKLHRGTLLDADYKHTREMKKKAKQAERDAAAAKGIYMPPESPSFSERMHGWVRGAMQRMGLSRMSGDRDPNERSEVSILADKTGKVQLAQAQ